MNTSLRRWTERVLLGAVAALLLAYLLDAGVYTLRGRSHGQPTATVKVSETAAIPLKSGKTELDSEGSMVVTCSRTIFPQDSYLPCWYLRRHAQKMDQF
jgi:hypothetical protein